MFSEYLYGKTLLGTLLGLARFCAVLPESTLFARYPSGADVIALFNSNDKRTQDNDRGENKKPITLYTDGRDVYSVSFLPTCKHLPTVILIHICGYTPLWPCVCNFFLICTIIAAHRYVHINGGVQTRRVYHPSIRLVSYVRRTPGLSFKAE